MINVDNAQENALYDDEILISLARLSNPDIANQIVIQDGAAYSINNGEQRFLLDLKGYEFMELAFHNCLSVVFDKQHWLWIAGEPEFLSDKNRLRSVAKTPYRAIAEVLHHKLWSMSHE